MPLKKKSSRTSSSMKMQGTPRELIVMTKAQAGLRATSAGLSSVSGANVSSLASLLKASGAKMVPVFGNEERVAGALASLHPEIREGVPNLSTFYKIEAQEDQLDTIARKLLNENLVDGAYVKPEMFPPVVIEEPGADPAEAPPVTPDFTPRQIYLNAAPAGIDARYAWTVPGGKGQGVRIIDIEGAWRFSHEDLTQNQGGVIGGSQSPESGWRNHGTAVGGEFGGDENGFGITGICPQASVRAISIFGGGQTSAKAITDAANALSPGDIILIELHAPGPRFNFQDMGGQLGFIAVEFWPADFAAIVYATSVRGVIVVEAGGNGAENLDDPLYNILPNTPPNVFPATWKNPFNLANPQSGAIIVGAGAPPPGTHGNDNGPDRSRLSFSNYGSRIDAQGWGREVTTTGYGDLQGGSNEDLWYTDVFSGTSSASPIVVGAIACAQGARRAAGKALLTPAAALNLLRTTGSHQQAGPNGPATQRIGNRPNLRQMIITLGPKPVTTVPLHRYWNPSAGDHFYTTNWNELGTGNFGWGYEGIQCHVLPLSHIGSVPLHRYWNPSVGDHFYTTNWNELGAGNFGWGYEGVQCHVYPTQIAGTVPLHRYWNPGIGDHFYTTNWAELGAGNYGWGYEGIQCYVFTQPASPPSAEGSPSDGDSSSGADPSGRAHREPSQSLEPVPATFATGLSQVAERSLGFEKSFLTAKTPAEAGGSSRDSSFKIAGAPLTSQDKTGKSAGQVTINIKLGTSPDEA